jgi:hypothetical protein
MNRRLALALVRIAPLALAACGAREDGSSSSASLSAPEPGPQPVFGAVTLANPPPPISGGTLTVAPDGRTAFAADPDRDVVYVVDLESRALLRSVPVPPGSEPGRVAVDAAGHAHVVLRSGGAVAEIDPKAGAVTETSLCAAPRGIAYDARLDALFVACADGDLVSIAKTGELRRVSLGRDLRDVLVTQDRILVSRFRSADVLSLSRALEPAPLFTAATHGGNVGWRMVGGPDLAGADPNEPAIVSQDPHDPESKDPHGYYGAGAADACDAPTITATRLDVPGEATVRIPPAVLPVDLATNGREYAMVAAGNGHTPSLPQLFVYRAKPPPPADWATAPSRGVKNPECVGMAKAILPGQAIAAAFDGRDELIVQSREPAALYVMSPDRQHVWKEIRLSSDSREDIGHAIFHSNSGGFIACASCHAEGGEDGRTWTILEGRRRTPSLRGTLAGTAPYHWDGQMKDIGAIVDHVFVTRMSGPVLGPPAMAALERWLFALPAPPNLALARGGAADAALRGEALFAARGCATCHAGPRSTDNRSYDVGTGGIFQVPSLVGVGWRGPYLHDGCAAELADRFGPCGGAHHGDTADLGPDQIADLVAFLDTL